MEMQEHDGAKMEKEKISATASNRGDVIRYKLRTRRGHQVLVALARKNRKEIKEI